MINRRSLITGLVSFVAAPAIVRVGSIMSVKVMPDWDGLYRARLDWAERITNPPVVYGHGPAMLALPDYIFVREQVYSMFREAVNNA